MITIDSLRSGSQILKEAVMSSNKEIFTFAYKMNDSWRIVELNCLSGAGFVEVYDDLITKTKVVRLESVYFPVQFLPTMIVSAYMVKIGCTEFDVDTLKILSLPVCFNSKTEGSK